MAKEIMRPGGLYLDFLGCLFSAHWQKGNSKKNQIFNDHFEPLSSLAQAFNGGERYNNPSRRRIL